MLCTTCGWRIIDVLSIMRTVRCGYPFMSCCRNRQFKNAFFDLNGRPSLNRILLSQGFKVIFLLYQYSQILQRNSLHFGAFLDLIPPPRRPQPHLNIIVMLSIFYPLKNVFFDVKWNNCCYLHFPSTQFEKHSKFHCSPSFVVRNMNFTH
jgi:hypothetical protein